MSSWNFDVGDNEQVGCHLRPRRMLDQKINGDDDDDCNISGAGGPIINVTVYYGPSRYEIRIHAQSFFGDLKNILSPLTGLDVEDQRLLFRGNEKDNDDCLHTVGVKDRGKLFLLENPAIKQRKLEQMKIDNEIMSACKAVVVVRTEVDKLAAKVAYMKSSMCDGGPNVTDKEFVLLTELLMVQLLKLDSIVGEGEAKVQRKKEVYRVQSLVEAVDEMKTRNLNASKSKIIGTPPKASI